MHFLQTVGFFLARLFLSIIFFMSATNNILDWQEAQKSMAGAIGDWATFSSGFSSISEFFNSILPYSSTILMGMVGLELFGALLLILAIKERFAAFLLILFLIPNMLLFHQFWLFEGALKQTEMVLFLNSLAIVGGLFYILVGAKGGGKKPHPAK